MATGKTPYRHVYIVGCGDIGTRVAAHWQVRGLAVTGVVRSEPSTATLSEAGIGAIQCDLGQAVCCLPPLEQPALLYYFAPPPNQGEQDMHVRHMLHCLEQAGQQPARIVAISTTGVYGDRAGERVSEEVPPNPQVDRARRRYDMECRLRTWCDTQNVDLIILRVGGIYGPGRLPLARIKQGVPMLHEHLAPKTNRIHSEDLARVCVAAAEVDQRYRVYNVSDGTDSNMTEYFLTLADYFQLPRPPLVDWDEAERVISPGMLSYLRESRRVDNTLMLKELGVKLMYPDLLSGLESCKGE